MMAGTSSSASVMTLHRWRISAKETIAELAAARAVHEKEATDYSKSEAELARRATSERR